MISVAQPWLPYVWCQWRSTSAGKMKQPLLPRMKEYESDFSRSWHSEGLSIDEVQWGLTKPYWSILNHIEDWLNHLKSTEALHRVKVPLPVPESTKQERPAAQASTERRLDCFCVNECHFDERSFDRVKRSEVNISVISEHMWTPHQLPTSNIKNFTMISYK